MHRRQRTRTPAPVHLETLEPRELFSLSKLPAFPFHSAPPAPANAVPAVQASPLVRQPALRAYVAESFYQMITTLPGEGLVLPGESRGGTPVKISIRYGDGTTGDALVGRLANDRIYVTGLHTYRTIGNLKLALIVTPQDGQPALTVYTNTVRITKISDNGRILTTRKRTISGVIGTVPNPGDLGKLKNPATTASRPASASQTAVTYSVNISWGDGTSSDGFLRSNKSGGYDVSGAHTYPQRGVYAISLNDGLTVDYGSQGSLGSANMTVAASLALVGISTGNGLPWRFPIPDLFVPPASTDVVVGPIDTHFPIVVGAVPFNPVHLTPGTSAGMIGAGSINWSGNWAGSLNIGGNALLLANLAGQVRDSTLGASASTIAGNVNTTLAIVDNATLGLGGQFIGAGSLNINGGLKGDANFSGTVNLGDFDKRLKTAGTLTLASANP